MNVMLVDQQGNLIESFVTQETQLPARILRFVERQADYDYFKEYSYVHECVVSSQAIYVYSQYFRRTGKLK